MFVCGFKCFVLHILVHMFCFRNWLAKFETAGFGGGPIALPWEVEAGAQGRGRKTQKYFKFMTSNMFTHLSCFILDKQHPLQNTFVQDNASVRICVGLPI